MKLPAPRIVEGRALRLAGFEELFNDQSSAGIPALWQRFQPEIGHIPGQAGKVAYGVIDNEGAGDRVRYFAGVEVKDFVSVPREFDRMEIAARRYAVFTHAGNVSAIRETWKAIWNEVLPKSALEVAKAPEFERYGENFDPTTGSGGVEIWIPLKPQR